MSDQLDDETLLNQAIRDLEPGVPVRSYVRDGEQLTLRLQDGRTIVYSSKNRAAVDDVDEAPDLDNLLKAELQDLAKQAGIEGYSTMLKAELVQALEALRDA